MLLLVGNKTVVLSADKELQLPDTLFHVEKQTHIAPRLLPHYNNSKAKRPSTWVSCLVSSCLQQSLGKNHEQILAKVCIVLKRLMRSKQRKKKIHVPWYSTLRNHQYNSSNNTQQLITSTQQRRLLCYCVVYGQEEWRNRAHIVNTALVVFCRCCFCSIKPLTVKPLFTCFNITPYLHLDTQFYVRDSPAPPPSLPLFGEPTTYSYT